MSIEQPIESSNSMPLIALPRTEPQKPDALASVFGQAPAADTLARWFECLGSLQRNAAGSRTFFENAAAAVCDPGGLDAGFVVSFAESKPREEGLPERRLLHWEIDASYVKGSTADFVLQTEILERVRYEARTLYHDASRSLETQTDFVIAAPVFDRDDKVVGAVYGIRSTNGQNKRRGVRPLEALWVQLVAEAVTAGFVRSELEADLVRNRVMLESAFAPAIVRQLLDNPDSLVAKERELTILFADLRNFTKTSEHLGPTETYRMLSDVMNRFTDQVIQHGGVIIDYYGDGMAAMWNAPTDQPDHANMACSAAIAIRDQLGELNEIWANKLPEALRIGIGLHCGNAIVGNAGSDRHIKYGPRGHAVNLTSRIETATKRIGITIAMSEEVNQRISKRMRTRRVCKAKLAGVETPIEIYELVGQKNNRTEDAMNDRLWRYEEALRSFERGDLETAEKILGTANDIENDMPSQLLIRAIEEQSSTTFSGVLDLTDTAKL